MARKKILIAEKDDRQSAQARKVLEESGHHVQTAIDGISAFKEISSQDYDLVLVDLDLPPWNGLDLLKRIRDVHLSLPVILMSESAGVKEAVEAMKQGAEDFLVKPLTYHMIQLIATQMSKNHDRTESVGENGKYTIITCNKEMKRILQTARDIAESQASAFIQGESGTGKELLARYIHAHSNRREKPFVAINCAALPETLLESELFGYEKGAFTGALTRKKGRFESANQGTLLLDEISEMDYSLQSKLLRVLQEKEIDRIGGTGAIPVDVRIIATTNRDIEKELKEGRFRDDLYYRLNVIPFHLPPLRERLDDIPLLVRYFMDRYNRRDHRSVKGLTPEALVSLTGRAWKGNLRELENIMERSVLLCKGELINEKDLFLPERPVPPEAGGYPFIPTISLKEIEKDVIFRALDQTNGNRTHAAEILGISVRTLRNKLNEYRKKMESH